MLSETDVAQLVALRDSGVSIAGTARELGRSYHAVHAMCRELGLLERYSHRYQPRSPTEIERAGRITLPPLPSLGARTC